MFGCTTCVTEVVTPGMLACCVVNALRVVWQTDGPTPLYIASQEGHVECVRVLLDMGAAIHQAAVGCTKLDGMAQQRDVCVWISGSLRACTRSSLGVRRCEVAEVSGDDERKTVKSTAPLHFAVVVVGEGTMGCSAAACVSQRW